MNWDSKYWQKVNPFDLSDINLCWCNCNSHLLQKIPFLLRNWIISWWGSVPVKMVYQSKWLSFYCRSKYYYYSKRAYQFQKITCYIYQLNIQFSWFLQVSMLPNFPDYIGSLPSSDPIQNKNPITPTCNKENNPPDMKEIGYKVRKGVLNLHLGYM